MQLQDYVAGLQGANKQIIQHFSAVHPVPDEVVMAMVRYRAKEIESKSA